MGDSSTDDTLLTTSQVAALLHVHPNTVRKWVNQGMLVAYRLGPRGDRRFSREQIEHFLRVDIHSTPEGPSRERPENPHENRRAP